MLDPSTCPLCVDAGHIQPSDSLPAAAQRCSRRERTLGVIGKTRLAEAVLPCVTSNVPFLPFTHVKSSTTRSTRECAGELRSLQLLAVHDVSPVRRQGEEEHVGHNSRGDNITQELH